MKSVSSKDIKPLTKMDKFLKEVTTQRNWKKDLVAYLDFCVGEGFIDEEVAQDLIDRRAWREIQAMIDWGDFEANE